MLASIVFWSCLSGSVFLVVGLVLIRKELLTSRGLDQILLLGCVFEAAPLAVFGTQHFLAASSIMKLVPHWIPAPLFWTYFVGTGLFAAALSFMARRHLRWSALLLGIMFFIFVATMDLPGAVAHPNNRIYWSYVMRETAFGAGPLALAGAAWQQYHPRLGKVLIAIGRTCVALALIFYSIEHFAFPKFAPGVPLEKVSPDWVPIPEFWAYSVGAVLLVSGIAMLLNRKTRLAAASVGAVMTLLTLFFYFPIFVKAWQTPLALDELNYLGDTLFFGGTVLLVGIELSQSSQQVSEPRDFPERERSEAVSARS